MKLYSNRMSKYRLACEQERQHHHLQIPFQQRPIKLQWNLVASAENTVDHLLGPQRTFAKRVLPTLPTRSGARVAPTLAW